MDFTVKRNAVGYLLFTKEQEEYILNDYMLNNNGSSSISQKFGISAGAVLRLLKRKGIATKDQTEYRQYDLDEGFFNTINTEEKAYWLGFLYADGYVDEEGNTVRINLARIDKRHLEKFQQALKTKIPIKETIKHSNNKEYLGCYLSVTCKRMALDLVKAGCYQRKSLTLKFPNFDIVPEDLMRHFIRGYFDGDGCLTYSTSNEKTKRRRYTVKLVGTENFFKQC